MTRINASPSFVQPSPEYQEHERTAGKKSALTLQPAPAPTGSHRATAGSVRRTMFYLAMPVLGEQMLNTFVGLFDIYLAGRFGAAATSAVGLSTYVNWLAEMSVMLVGTGTTALVARHVGSGDETSANRCANQSLTLAAVLGIAALILFYTLAPAFALYTRLTDESARIAIEYLRINAVGTMMLSFTLVGCAAFRGAGNMRTPMFIFMVVNGVNILASCAFVFGLGPIPALGVTGIVCGTVTAQTLGALLTLALFIKGRTCLKLTAANLIPHWHWIRRILRIGLPAAADGAIMWTGHFVLLAVIARLADPPTNEILLAAHMIAVRTEALTYLPAVAWAATTATMIGQALGAGDPQRARRAGHEGVFQCGIIGVVITLFFLLGADFIYHHMSADPMVRLAGAGPFRILALFQLTMVLSIVYIGGLRGAGDTRVPMFITAAGALMRITACYLFGIVWGAGLLGAWMGMFIDMTWRAVAAMLRFRHGKWVHISV